MSPELRQFLTEWLEWVESGAEDHRVFKRYKGLCATSFCYSGGKLARELKKLLPKTADLHYPFGGAVLYWDERCNNTMHLNEQRLAWVREQLNLA